MATKPTTTGSGGGLDREWLRPLDQSGTRQSDNPSHDNMVGCHTGKYFGFNLKNPQPNFEYVWENYNRDDMDRIRFEGGQFVRHGDPESPIQESLTVEGGGALEPTQLDSLYVHRGCVLTRYPIEVIRARRAEEAATARAMMRGGAEEYAEGVNQMEAHLSRGLPTRFRRRDHRLDYLDGNENIVDQWAPDTLPES